MLAHNYMTPEIFHCVADCRRRLAPACPRGGEDRRRHHRAGRRAFHGRDLEAAQPRQDGADPRLRAGCSLAASITGADVRALREAYPGVPVVTYVNTSAEVKAECDICCTSSNAVRVVESLGVQARHHDPRRVSGEIGRRRRPHVEIITWKGHCEVHERFTGEELRAYREADPGVKIIAHPECAARRDRGGRFHRLDRGMIKWVQGQPADARCCS